MAGVRPGAMGRTQRSMCAGMLGLQAVVLFLTTPVMLSLTDVDTVVALVVGLGLTLACLVGAGTMRRSWGGVIGWAVQGCSILLGFVITVMFFLGLIFGALYAGAWFLGAKVDREQAARGPAPEA